MSVHSVISKLILSIFVEPTTSMLKYNKKLFLRISRIGSLVGLGSIIFLSESKFCIQAKGLIRVDAYLRFYFFQKNFSKY